MLNQGIERRAKEIGKYVVSTGATVRTAAEKFGISKSTVHKDLAERLKNIDVELYNKVHKVLDFNRSQRHIRGGMATKQKFKKK